MKTPPFSAEARLEAGYLRRQLQTGIKLGLPHSRPMRSIGVRCHELRIQNADQTWRIVYRLDHDAIVLLDVFSKRTPKTPKSTIDACKKRMKQYDAAKKGK